MKQKTLIKKLKLSEKDFQDIKAAIQNAEEKTTGEIAVAVAPESAHYSFWELLFANLIAALALICLLPFADKFYSIYQTVYWQNQPSWLIPAFFVITCFSTVAITFYIANIPFIDRIIIPNAVKKSCVTHRAFRYFTESGVYDTAEHSGILIFVSFMEHQVRILADSGIAKRISQDLWNLIADELAEDIKNGKTAQAFLNAVSKCGDLLAEQFPAKEENPNEISDGLVILGDLEWY